MLNKTTFKKLNERDRVERKNNHLVFNCIFNFILHLDTKQKSLSGGDFQSKLGPALSAGLSNVTSST